MSVTLRRLTLTAMIVLSAMLLNQSQYWLLIQLWLPFYVGCSLHGGWKWPFDAMWKTVKGEDY